MVTAKIDKTPPSLSGAPATAPNANGWYRDDVGIGWTSADALSDINGACPSFSVITGEGKGLSTSASVADKAGNATVATSAPVNIDRTPPVTVASAPSGWTNATVSLTLTPSDNLSGVQATYYTIDGGSQRGPTRLARRSASRASAPTPSSTGASTRPATPRPTRVSR